MGTPLWLSEKPHQAGVGKGCDSSEGCSGVCAEAAGWATTASQDVLKIEKDSKEESANDPKGANGNV
jgi:hypothetical protein